MPIRTFTDAEVLVSERRRLERPLVVLVWMGIALFSLSEGGMDQSGPSGAFFLLAGSMAAGIKLYAVSRGRELLLRHGLVTAGVLLATALVLFSLVLDWGNVKEVVHLGHYVILIQLCKLFERAKNRDYAQILIMSVVTLTTACVLPGGERLWFAAAVAAYLALACHTAMVLTLKRGLDAAVQSALPTEAGPLPAHKVAWNVRRDWPTRPLRRVLAPILLAMFAMGAMFFLAAPRVIGASARMPLAQKNISVSGYSNRVQLGDAKTVQLSDQEALRLRATAADPNRIALPLYLRGHLLDHYEQSRWYSSPAGGFAPWRAARELDPAGGAPPPPGALRQEVRMDGGLLPTVFGVAPVLRAWAAEGDLSAGPHGEVRLTFADRPPAGRVHYVVESLPDLGENVPARPLAPEDESFSPDPLDPDALEGAGAERTTITPRVQSQASEWCRDLLDRRPNDPNLSHALDLAIAHRLANRLRQTCRYSLDLSGCDPSRDGVEDFLFHMKQGHCEYFASALTVMCRALDVRARLATGFRADELAPPGQWTIVRARDAHAWTEVYSPGRGWVVFDATPAGEPAPVVRHWYSFLTDAWDDAHQFWYLRVIRYSEQDREDFANIFRGWLRGLRDAAAALWQAVVGLFASGEIDQALVHLAIALGAIAAVAEALVLVHVVRRRTRLARSLRRATGDRWRQARFLVRLLRLLERRGLPPRPELTLLETAARAEEALSLPPGEARALVRLYYRLRWGGQDLAPQEILAAESAVDALCKTPAARRRPL